jgi:drug/metabolite transporter (DMT)-like permease
MEHRRIHDKNDSLAAHGYCRLEKWICSDRNIFYSRPKELTFGKNTWGGALFYALMVLCFVTANKMTTAGNVILIQYAAPVYVALFGFSFLGEKSTKVDWLAIIIILTGLGFFS